MQIFRRRDIELSEKQKEAVEFVKKFKNSSFEVLIITGEAGSGKTETIKQIFNNTNSFENTSVAALSGRAAAVLRNKGIPEAVTIASLLYGKPTFSWERRVLNREQDTRRRIQNARSELFIFDEASMIPDFYDETSSWSHRKQEVEIKTIEGLLKNNNKIVFVGDLHQLGPPVSNRPYKFDHSNALNPFYWEELGYKVHAIDLDTTFRQQSNSQLLYLARGIISEDKFIKPYICESVERIDNEDEVINKYFELNNDNNSVKILSFMNTDVYKWNKRIRDKKFDIKYDESDQSRNSLSNNDYKINREVFNEKAIELIKEDEILLVTDNNRFYATELLNGDNLVVTKILSPPTPGEVINNMPVKINESKNGIRTEREENFKDFYLTYQDVEIMKIDATAYEEKFLKVKLILETIETQKIISSQNRSIRTNIIETYLREEFEKRNKSAFEKIEKDETLTIFEKEEQRQKLYERDEYFNALRVSYGYALTTHKAQGGEWKNIIVSFESKRSQDTRWAYTSITRASEKVFLFEYPESENSLRPLNYTNPVRRIIENLQQIFRRPTPVSEATNEENGNRVIETEGNEIQALRREIQELQKRIQELEQGSSGQSSNRIRNSRDALNYTGPVDSNGILEKELAYEIQNWRLEKARSQGAPAFTIFDNKTLNNIAYFEPKTIDELSRIRGLGPNRIRDYGEEIITLVNKYR